MQRNARPARLQASPSSGRVDQPRGLLRAVELEEAALTYAGGSAVLQAVPEEPGTSNRSEAMCWGIIGSQLMSPLSKGETGLGCSPLWSDKPSMAWNKDVKYSSSRSDDLGMRIQRGKSFQRRPAEPLQVQIRSTTALPAWTDYLT